MKLRDTLSATLLAHADAPRRWKTPLSPDPAKTYPIWQLAVRTLLWAMFFTGLCWLGLKTASGQWIILWWPFWMVVSIGVVWGGMTVFAWNRRSARVRAAVAAGQPAPAGERLPVWSRLTVVPLYYLLFFIVTPLVLALTVANQISARKWANYRAELVARGVMLDLMAMVHKPVPDPDNFATTPLFKDFGLTHEAIASPAGQAAIKRLEKISLPIRNQPTSATWPTQKKIELAKYRASFTNAALFPQARDDASDATAVLTALKAWDAELREIESAADRPIVAFQMRYQDTFMVLIPHLPALKQLSSIHRLRACARLGASDASGALRDIKTCWGLGKISASEPLMISFLVGIAIDGQAIQPIWEGLRVKAWNESQLAELDSLLSSRNYGKLCRRSLDAERAFSTTTMEQWISNPSGMAWASQTLANNEGLMDLVRVLPTRFIITENLISQNQWTDALLPRDGSVPDFREAKQTLDGLLALPRHPRYILVRLLYPAIGNFLQKAAAPEAHQSLARTAIALERHALATGNYPDSLSALTPKFLPKALNDPFSKAPLHYTTTTDGRYLLYSVGPNGRDDQGRAVKKKEKDIARIAATENPQTPPTATADDIAWTYLPLEK